MSKVECKASAGLSIFSFKSKITIIIFEAEKEGIRKIRFATKMKPCRGSFNFKPLRHALERYFRGAEERFTSIPLVYPRDGFAGKVMTALRKVRHGATVSYGELARLAGYPGASRAVGTVMAKNPLPLIVPCHRVVPATGGIGKFGSGPALKKKLLELEGALD